MKNRITNILLIILIVLVGILTIVQFGQYTGLDSRITDVVRSAYHLGRDGKDGYTPIKNVDYFDGRDGLNGQDGVNTTVHDYTQTTITLSGTNGEKGDTGKSAYEIWLDLGNTGTEQDFIDSLKQVNYPDFRCNTVKNRWEIKYPGDETWQILNGEVVPCVGAIISL